MKFLNFIEYFKFIINLNLHFDYLKIFNFFNYTNKFRNFMSLLLKISYKYHSYPINIHLNI